MLFVGRCQLTNYRLRPISVTSFGPRSQIDGEQRSPRQSSILLAFLLGEVLRFFDQKMTLKEKEVLILTLSYAGPFLNDFTQSDISASDGPTSET